METTKVKIEITATDTVGREESINLRVERMTAFKLTKSEDLFEKLRDLLDIDEQLQYYGQSARYFSKSQCRKIEGFLDLCFHKFYNYSLKIKML